MIRRRTAASVVTGFLGSGKTTLVRGLLERDASRERIAVIVNELGDVGIDGRVLTGFEFIENVVELASGCVCCSIDEYRFDLAVEELVRRVDPQIVVLETTGVADPAPTLERLRRSGLGVDSVVTVVDATSWTIAWRTSPTARRQIAAADFLVISKCDLVTRPKIDRLRARLARVNPRAVVLESAGGAQFAGAELLLATSAARAAGESVPHAAETSATTTATGSPEVTNAGTHLHHLHHLHEEKFESFSWRAAEPVDRDAFVRVLERLPRSVLRAKGFVRGEGDAAAWLFQVVCGRVELGAFDSGRALAPGGEGVFLGPGVLALRDHILAALRDCERPAGHSNRTGSADRSDRTDDSDRAAGDAPHPAGAHGRDIPASASG